MEIGFQSFEIGVTLTGEKLYSNDGYIAKKTYNIDLGNGKKIKLLYSHCLLYTSPSPRDATLSRMPSSA